MAWRSVNKSLHDELSEDGAFISASNLVNFCYLPGTSKVGGIIRNLKAGVLIVEVAMWKPEHRQMLLSLLFGSETMAKSPK
jgi:hypothetical protein